MLRRVNVSSLLISDCKRLDYTYLSIQGLACKREPSLDHMAAKAVSDQRLPLISECVAYDSSSPVSHGR